VPVRQDLRHEYTAVHMDMPVRIVLYAPAGVAAAAARSAFDRIAALEDILSDYRPQSELRRLEQRAGEWVPVSEELFAVLERALFVARLSGGAYDPTVAPLVELWREARRTGRMPHAAALDAARARVGWQRVELDSARSAVRLHAGTRLDVGGIAKGWVLQDALRVLREHGAARALVEAGGDIVVGAAPPGRSGWRIDVPGSAGDGDAHAPSAAGGDHADGPGAFAARAAALVNAALATSGDAAQFVDIDGVRYSHVVDPRTGIGVTHRRTVHVIAADAALADALATALGVLGVEAAARVLAAFPDVVIRAAGDVHAPQRRSILD
jgi:FAD:protein FMN transferase